MRGCFVSVCRSLQKTLLEAEEKNRSNDDPTGQTKNENSKNSDSQNSENTMEQRQTDTTPQNCDAAYF